MASQDSPGDVTNDSKTPLAQLVHSRQADDTYAQQEHVADITGEMGSLNSEIYCSVDHNADRLEDSRYASLTANQNALDRMMTNTLIYGFRGGPSNAPVGLGLFGRLNHQPAFANISNPGSCTGAANCISQHKVNSGTETENNDLLNYTKEKMQLVCSDPSSDDVSTVIYRKHAHNSSSSTANDRRRDYRKSSDLWQEEERDDGGNDVFCVKPEIESTCRYSRQTSETGSLPDVILSNSASEMMPTSPDLVSSDPSLGLLYHSSSNEHVLPRGITSQSSEVSSQLPAASDDKKLQMEGKVHDPRPMLRRQVSFSRKISICENGKTIDGTCVTSIENDPIHESYASRTNSHEERLSSSSADEKRHRYSDRTSGYGTGESSKNSTQNGSTGEDQADIHENDVFAQENMNNLELKSDPGKLNQPILSILNATFTSSSSTFSDCSNHTPIDTAESFTTSVTTLAHESRAAGMLPNLSILGSEHDSSFMVSMPEHSASQDFKDDPIFPIPPEVEFCLTPAVCSMESSRTSASDNYALKTLELFQRSPSSSTNSYQSQVSSEKPQFYSQKSSQRGQTHKAHLQKIREELIANHIEDLLFHLNHIQSETAEFENVMYRIKHVLASESTSPSPMTPLTPLLRQGSSPSERGLVPKADYQTRRSFSFETNQTLELRSKQKETQNCLVLSSRCEYYLCPYPRCKRGKELWKGLETSLLTRPFLTTYIEYTEVLTCLFEHSQQCDEFKCPVPWCTFLNLTYSNQSYEDIDLKQVTKKLSELARFPTMRFTCMTNNNEETFYPLNSQFSTRPLMEGTDWMALIRMGKFGSSVLAMENQSQDKWVVKRVQLTHPEEDNRLKVYRKLKGHTCSHIVTYLWMKQSVKVLLVSSTFEPGGTLHDHLQTNGPFKAQHALHFFHQILSAAAYLHDFKILYLYWKAKNVVLDKKGVVKLCNFSTAVYYDDSYDIEELLWLIPATLLCPELLSGKELCPEVDSWGLGCLLVELVTGMSSRQDLIHYDRTAVEQQIKESPLPTIIVGNSTVQDILNKCWKINLNERLPASQLKEVY